MRAAFKAVDSGYQVAVLVPTTILPEQHYRTFLERMAEFLSISRRLSRFCASKEEPRDPADWPRTHRYRGGTHRLASRDVRFHNLGLVIIDEEQRFGVEVKERLKTFSLDRRRVDDDRHPHPAHVAHESGRVRISPTWRLPPRTG